MKVQLSLTNKVMLLFVLVMLTISIITSLLIINQSTASMERQHTETLVRNKHQLDIFHSLLTERTAAWVDVLSSIQLMKPRQLEKISQIFEQAQSTLNVTMQINDVWIFDAQQQLVYQQVRSPPAFVANIVASAHTQHDVATYVDCQQRCLRYVAIPIMVPTTDNIVVVVSINLVELLYLLKQTSGVEQLAIVKFDKEAAADTPALKLVSRLNDSAFHVMTQVINHLSVNLNMQALRETGSEIRLGERQLLISQLPLSTRNNEPLLILFVNDISQSVKELNRYKMVVIGSALGLFLLFSLLLYFFLNQYRKKLLRLSQHLPMLAQHRYQAFRLKSARPWFSPLARFVDELDILEYSANELATQLEAAHKQIASKTAQLENMAMFDTLTGLPNRNMLVFHIEKQLAITERTTRAVAVMFIDLDDFKKVNDSHGHDVGDQLLKEASKRLVTPIREGDIAARFGGDEFVVLLTNLATPSQVESVANKLMAEFSQPLTVDNIHFYISISIGVALGSGSQHSVMELFKHADTAMYEAKRQKGPSFRIYDSAMNDFVVRRVEIESLSRTALREDRFSLALQPQLELSSGNLVGFEVLLRWTDPQKGEIAPDEFIPLVENTAFMAELDRWVITQGVRLLRELKAHGYPNIRLAINLSSEHFLDPKLPEFIATQIAQNDIDPNLLELELTETVLVYDLERTTQVMKTIRSIGCLIAIDDFGTGYASLSYLKALPADSIKIDKSFIAGMLHCSDDKNIVHSTIMLVQEMGLTVIAEGIENRAQYRLLREFNCNIGQGFLISKPIPESQLWGALIHHMSHHNWNQAIH